MGAGDLNSGLGVCMQGTLAMEPSLQPTNYSVHIFKMQRIAIWPSDSIIYVSNANWFSNGQAHSKCVSKWCQSRPDISTGCLRYLQNQPLHFDTSSAIPSYTTSSKFTCLAIWNSISVPSLLLYSSSQKLCFIYLLCAFQNASFSCWVAVSQGQGISIFIDGVQVLKSVLGTDSGLKHVYFNKEPLW